MSNLKETKYGFDWGPVSLQRYCSDDNKGWVVLGLKTQRTMLQIYVTRTGFVRIHDGKSKWEPKP